MGQSTQHYAIFETNGGFCGIAWNSVGVTRFQLPTGNAEATERLLLRRVPEVTVDRVLKVSARTDEVVVVKTCMCSSS